MDGEIQYDSEDINFGQEKNAVVFKRRDKNGIFLVFKCFYTTIVSKSHESQQQNSMERHVLDCRQHVNPLKDAHSYS